MSQKKNSTVVLNALRRLQPDASGMYAISADQRKRWMKLLEEVDARDESRQKRYKGKRAPTRIPD